MQQIIIRDGKKCILGIFRWSDCGAINPVFTDGIRDKTRLLEVRYKASEKWSGLGTTCFREPHRLPNSHKGSVQYLKLRVAPLVDLKLLSDSCRDIVVSVKEHIDYVGRRLCMNDGRIS